MDVAILCGGYGTRLSGLWNGPKCLVPLGDGRPVIAHILQLVYRLHPKNTILLTAYKGDEVSAALRAMSLTAPTTIILRETEPKGTAAAVRLAAKVAPGPLMVLNGDTLPRYDLHDLARAWHASHSDVLEAWCGGLRAGATILSARAIKFLMLSGETDLYNLITSEYFGRSTRIFVAGFLDVGTPHGFELAGRWLDNTKESA